MLDTLRAYLPLAAGAFTFLGVFLLILGVAASARRDPIERRVIGYTPGPRSLTDLELEQPLMERFVRPLATQIARLVERLTPARATESVEKQLLHAGLMGRMQVSDFLGIKGFLTFLGVALAVALALLTGQGALNSLLLVALAGVAAYLVPDVWLRGKITERRNEVIRALPDVIDLLTITIEAGLGFDLALARVVRKWDNALTREFGRVIQEMRIGVARRDALRAMVERTGVDDLSTFVSAVLQAEQLGASISNVLRIQSVEMRVRRRQNAERLAHLAPVKILFPMVFLIFPPILIVILGPAIPEILRAFLPGIPL